MKNKERVELKKKKIIEFLMNDGDLIATSKIANHIKSDQNRTLNYLNNLVNLNKIEKIKSPTAIYWKIRYKKLPKNQTMKEIKKEVLK